MEVKTKTPSGVTFKVAGTRDDRSSLITGDIEAKYSLPKKGLVFTQTWTTANILRAQLELDNQIAEGLKIDVTSSLAPEKGERTALITSTYKQPGIHSRVFLDVFKVSRPSPPFSVFPHTSWLGKSSDLYLFSQGAYGHS